MDFFLSLSVGFFIFLVFLCYNNPKQWHTYVTFFPLSLFMFAGRLYGMTNIAWQNAFILAGFCTVFILIYLSRQNIIFDRLMLGVNLFFLVGAFGFLFHNKAIIKWYGMTKGGPFFSCIAIVGLFATLFTKPGFVGVKHKNSQAVQYASFLLFAATVIALIWSIRSDDQGLLFAVVIPFLLLKLIQDLLVRQMD